MVMKVLALHGKQQNAEVLRARFGRLPQKAKGIAEFQFVDAPHELDLQNPEDEVAMRAWWHREIQPDGSLLMTSSSISQSLDMLERIWNSGGFCGIFGFSMGGIMASIIAALPERFPGLNFVIIAGAPNERQVWLRGQKCGDDWSASIPPHVRCLCILGQTDQVVPLQSGMGLAARFSQSTIIEHPQGHHIPTQAAYLKQYVEFLQEMQDYIQKETVAGAEVTLGGSRSFSFECASDDVATSQAEEWEVLNSIYPAELQLISASVPVQKGDQCLHFSITITPLPACSAAAVPIAWDGNIGLEVTLTHAYPHHPDAYPVIEVATGALTLMDGFNEAMRYSLLRDIASAMGASDENVFTESYTAAHASLDPTDDPDPKLLNGIQAAFDWFADGKWFSLQSSAGNNTKAESVQDIPSTTVGTEAGSECYDEEVIDMSSVRAATEDAWRVASAIGVCTDEHAEEGCFSCISHEVDSKNTDQEHVLLPDSARGVWPYTVGLVGKPSAGKSTFFNAVTQAALSRNARLMAAVAPHPFTTIEPNVGPGWYASLDVDETTSADETRHPVHGYVKVATAHHSICFDLSSKSEQQKFAFRRRLPVCVKDVAGLVPGAYQGRGKGNRFLADLCDADVLVHVVDVTGKADKDGNIVGIGEKGSNPIEDAEWIRAELHCWIFGNVISKWHSVLRQKSEKAGDGNSKCRQRVIALFSGYQGPRWCVEVAARRAQLQLSNAYLWTKDDVHRLVAHFLSVRFPMCLALNKIDELGDDYVDVISECQRIALSRGEIAVPVCAKAECAVLLQHQQMAVKIAAKSSDEDVCNKIEKVYGTTGVLEAISASVRLKPPVLCYPVSDLDTEYPVGWSAGRKILSTHSINGGDDATSTPTIPRLQDCIQLKIGSTAGDVFEALKRGALSHATVVGELVRVDARSLFPSGRKMQLSRNSIIDGTNCVLRVQTNKKSVWQADLLRKKEQEQSMNNNS